MKSLQNQRIIITGAARGIGAELARKLAARGARVGVIGLEPDRLQALAKELGPDHVWFECDVTSKASMAAAMSHCIEHLGGVDTIVANAGISSNGTLAVTPVEALCRTVEVNLIGVIQTVSAALPAITASRGYILLVASAAALKSVPGTSAYAASKIGVDHFGSAIRLELAHKGIDVGVAYPAWVSTDMVKDNLRDLPSFNDALKHLPWPFNVVSTVDNCAQAMADAIARRRRKVYVPGALAPLGAIRQLFMSPLWEFFVKRQARITVPKLESEVLALGRSFGVNSMGGSSPQKNAKP
jgi:short-subunit dehydrogenase